MMAEAPWEAFCAQYYDIPPLLWQCAFSPPDTIIPSAMDRSVLAVTQHCPAAPLSASMKVSSALAASRHRVPTPHPLQFPGVLGLCGLPVPSISAPAVPFPQNALSTLNSTWHIRIFPSGLCSDAA